MPNFNKVILVGHLTRDPELRYTPSGVPVGGFGFAVNRSYTTQAGEKRDEVCFIEITVWGKLAEICVEHLKKGRPALIEGYLAQETWTGRDQQKHSKHKIVAERVQFLGGKPSGPAAPGQPKPGEQEAPPEDDVPF